MFGFYAQEELVAGECLDRPASTSTNTHHSLHDVSISISNNFGLPSDMKDG